MKDKKMFAGKKGQDVIAGVVILGAAIIAVVVMLDPLQRIIDRTVSNLSENTEAGSEVTTLVLLLPLFLILSLMALIFRFRSGGVGV